MTKRSDLASVELYLDLLKRTLTGSLFEENDVILGVTTRGNPGWKSRLANPVGAVFSSLGMELVYKRPYDPELRAGGRDWPARGESMIGLKRMDNIQDCVTTVLAEDIEGDLIETGVWRGGATIFMRAILKAYGDTKRKVWVADSFEGLPRPDARRYPADAEDELYRYGTLRVGAEQVRHNFARYGLLDDQVEFLVGWFRETLPVAPIEKLAILRLDGDLYESTMQAIEALYPKLSAGGFCIVDDYGMVPGCQQAISDYRTAQGITDEIIDIDGAGVYWRRSPSYRASSTSMNLRNLAGTPATTEFESKSRVTIDPAATTAPEPM